MKGAMNGGRVLRGADGRSPGFRCRRLPRCASACYPEPLPDGTAAADGDPSHTCNDSARDRWECALVQLHRQCISAASQYGDHGPVDPAYVDYDRLALSVGFRLGGFRVFLPNVASRRKPGCRCCRQW